MTGLRKFINDLKLAGTVINLISPMAISGVYIQLKRARLIKNKRMKQLFTMLLLCGMAFGVNAQEVAKKDTPEEQVLDTTVVLTLDHTIKSLYDVISGESGEKRNWKQFKFLFHPNAKLIPGGRDDFGDYKVLYMDPKAYIKQSGPWLEEHGFFEKEIHRKTEMFGNMAHVFSTYESFHSEADEESFMRGINSIQLFNDSKRWWIINIFWSQETQINPIPKSYLP